MKLSYKLKRIGEKPDPITMKVCDEGAVAMKQALVTTAKVAGGFWAMVLIWVLTRFCRRIVLPEEIQYDFYLITG